MNDIFKDKLTESIKIASIHKKRLNEAYQTIASWGDFNIELYSNLNNTQIAVTDQFVFRFAKLQDIIGEKILKQSLDYLGENTERLPFIDILNKSHKIGLIADAQQWMILRESRNQIAHDYAILVEDVVTLFVSLLRKNELLIVILDHIIQFLSSKGLEIEKV
ncbi:MAG: hypothetical protein SFY32_02470 [Bacteroidota bacterium]|nr:hypothetical protein [Bacteroidota bacterium]